MLSTLINGGINENRANTLNTNNNIKAKRLQLLQDKSKEDRGTVFEVLNR